MSYKGSVVLDFFAGSAVTTRVAIELGRHSISTDTEAVISEYLASHLSKWKVGDVPESPLPYKLLGADEFDKHPIFGIPAEVPQAAE